MVASIERIEQDIAALDAAIAALAHEFHNTYSGYLEALGKSVRQQLILATYHICTRSYPKPFLELSFNQRQQLQQAVQDLAQQVQQNLVSRLQPILPPQMEDAPSPAIEAEESVDEDDEFLKMLSIELAKPVSPATNLLRWQTSLERGVGEELRIISHAINLLLQQADVLPKKLPQPILEAAIRADAAEAAGAAPNLLSLMIEAVGEGEVEKKPEELRSLLEVRDKAELREKLNAAAIMHVTTVRLRLSEIEFADSSLTAWRTRIRNLSSRLQALGRDYEKKQQERTIAEAEAAWRISWVEK